MTVQRHPIFGRHVDGLVGETAPIAESFQPSINGCENNSPSNFQRNRGVGSVPNGEGGVKMCENVNKWLKSAQGRVWRAKFHVRFKPVPVQMESNGCVTT